MIEIKNLNKSYNNQIVLNNLSMKIDKGDFISIVGPSGVGTAAAPIDANVAVDIIPS